MLVFYEKAVSMYPRMDSQQEISGMTGCAMRMAEAYEDVCKHFDVSDDEKKGRIGSGLWFMILTNLTHHKSKTPLFH